MFINVQFPKNTNIPDKTKIEVTKGFEGFYKDKNGLPHIKYIIQEYTTEDEQIEREGIMNEQDYSINNDILPF